MICASRKSKYCVISMETRSYILKWRHVVMLLLKHLIIIIIIIIIIIFVY